MPKLEHGHSAEEIKERFETHPEQSYLRDVIYGGIDGVVTTFAVVSGVVGGQLSPVIVLILGFANLLADGFSMAAGNYLGTKSDIEQYLRYKKIEENHIKITPEGEKAEIAQIFRNKGLEGDSLKDVVEAITSNKDVWINTMLQEEYGLPSVLRSPVKAAIYTFIAFVVFGLVPLLPYILFTKHAFLLSSIATGITFFVIGSIKSFWSTKSWLRSGLETLGIGAIAALVAYYIGFFLRTYLTG